MQIWTVKTASGEEERVEAELLAAEGGALIAFSDRALIVRAWAPGQWQTVRHITGMEAHPSSQPRSGANNVVIGLPRI
jgi:hypothetical protein